MTINSVAVLYLLAKGQSMKGHKHILNIIILIIVVLLFSHYRIDIYSHVAPFLSSMQNVKVTYVIAALALYILSVYLFALRWKTVLNSLGYNLKANSLFPIIFGAIPINNLTPANRAGGEPLRMLWVKTDLGVSYPDSVVSIIFERSVEAIPFGLMGIYVIYVVMPFWQGAFAWINDLGYLTLTLILLILLSCFFKKSIIKLLHLVFSKYIISLKKYYTQLNSVFLPTLLLSSAVWTLDVMRLKLITMALGLHVHLNVLLLISVLYLILGSIPLTPGGLGIVEGGLYSSIGIL